MVFDERQYFTSTHRAHRSIFTMDSRQLSSPFKSTKNHLWVRTRFVTLTFLVNHVVQRNNVQQQTTTSYGSANLAKSPTMQLASKFGETKNTLLGSIHGTTMWKLSRTFKLWNRHAEVALLAEKSIGIKSKTDGYAYHRIADGLNENVNRRRHRR